MSAYLAEIIPYWHQHIDQPNLPAFERYKAWYDPDDGDIGDRFRDLLETLLEEPVGARDIANTAATILVLDQFPRKLHGKTAAAYAGHDLAAGIAAPLLESGQDDTLQWIERIAVAMCLCNTEVLSNHDVASAWFDRHVQSLDGETGSLLEGFREIAGKRREIIRLYGRFPPRNRPLGRASTPAEAYMVVGHGFEYE